MHRTHHNHHDHPARASLSWFVYRFAGGRHGHRSSHGFVGGFADDRDGDGHGFRRGRKISSNDLQLVILALISEKPRHGYEIIKALEELSAGFYVPSPGVVYPSLSYLEDAGYVAVEAEGSRKLHRLTESGGSYLAEHRETADAMLSQIEKAGQAMEQFRQTLKDEDADPHHRRGRRHGELGRSRAALKSALFDLRDATAEEEARVAAILDRATAEIRAVQAERKP